MPALCFASLASTCPMELCLLFCFDVDVKELATDFQDIDIDLSVL